MKVVILCGVSGAGKSTRTQREYPEAFVYSADLFFMKDGEYKFDPKNLSEAHGTCLREFVDGLKDKQSLIVVDNTNTSVAEIAPYAALALAYGYELEIEILKVDAEVAAARNQHGVPKATIVKMAERINNLKNELPSWWPCKEV